MLKGLRIQLILLSLAGAVGLVVLLGGGSYYLLKLYMQRSTDLALQAKMAMEFRQYGLPLPPELASAEQDWLGNQNHPAAVTPQSLQAQFRDGPTITARPTLTDIPTKTPPPPTATPITPTATSVPTARSQANAALASQSQLTNPTARPPSKSGEDGEENEDNHKQDENNVIVRSKPNPTNSPSGILIGQIPSSPAGTAPASTNLEENDGNDREDGASVEPSESSPSPGLPSSVSESENETLDEQLNSVFVVPIDTSGQVIQNSSLPANTTILDKQASAAALVTGYDLRTAQLSDGSRARLLTYRTAVSGGPELLQVGRLLKEQDQILRWFLTGVLVLAAISAILLGLGSWWLTGRALNPAQRAWENQQTFIANASHELRAPLTLVKANAEVGLRMMPPPEQKEVLTEILNDSDYMNRLVEDLLLLSRLDAHRLKLERITIEVKDLLGEVQRHMSLIAERKGVSIILGGTGGKIWGDPVRIRQVILILIDNSLRFTPDGGQISLESHPAAGTVRITVSDNGAGISATDLPHVFDRFYQAGRSIEEDARGNGLGLSIAKALIEAQKGEIHIASIEGDGTKVSIQLPSSD